MKCPYCKKPASAFSALRISRWTNFKCPACGKESNRSALNSVLVYFVAIALAIIVEYVLAVLGFVGAFWVHILVFTGALLCAEKLLCNLVPDNET